MLWIIPILIWIQFKFISLDKSRLSIVQMENHAAYLSEQLLGMNTGTLIWSCIPEFVWSSFGAHSKQMLRWIRSFWCANNGTVPRSAHCPRYSNIRQRLCDSIQGTCANKLRSSVEILRIITTLFHLNLFFDYYYH